jgi:hypothetical protein
MMFLIPPGPPNADRGGVNPVRPKRTPTLRFHHLAELNQRLRGLWSRERMKEEASQLLMRDGLFFHR